MSNEVKVLHVDDEPDFADMTAQFLMRESDRIAVEVAQDADEALRKISQSEIDCIVSDYDMPGQNGIEFLEAVRQDSPALPFILFTGKGSEEIASDAISAGVTDYLQKERGTDQYVILANRIENAVDKLRAERRAEESQALYRSLTDDALDTSEVGTFILDSDFQIVWINSAIETYFEIDRNEVIGKDKRELITSEIASLFEEPEEFVETVTATYDNNTYSEEFECHILPTEGTDERWLRHWSQPIETGHFAGGRIEHYTDITAYKAREQEISRLNELHETVLANIRDTVLLTDDDGHFTYVCPNVEFIFGYDRDEVRDIGTIEALLGERLVEYDELIEQREIHNIETSVKNRQGTRRQLLATVTAVDIQEGSCLYSIRDITNLSDREREYRELSRRHQLALDGTDTGVWEWNMETDEVVWSEAMERLLGIEQGEFEGTFEAHEEYVHPESRANIEKGIEQALDDDGEFEEELRMIREDGEVIWVVGQGKIFTDDGPPRMIGITTEITERVEREQALEESEERYRKLLATAPTPILIYDQSEEVVYANQKAVELFGAEDEEEILGLTPQDFIHPDSRDELDDRRRRLIEENQAVPPNELTLLDHDGREKTVLVASSPITYEGEPAIQTVATDITELKDRERQLERYETLVEVSGDPMYMMDADGHLEYVNEAFVERVGYEEDELLGEHVSKVLVDDHVERGEGLIQSLLTSGDRRGTFEMEAITKSGDRIPAEVHISLLYRDGEFSGTVGVLRDIADRLERERRLQRERDRLDEFASVVSHDLRNPLNVARSRLELAMEEHESEDLAAAERALHRMERLIEDVLSLARVGESVGETELVQLSSLVEACWRNVDTDTAELNVETDASILADKTRLQQLLENLIRNAVEHGGSEVTVTVGDVPDGFFVEDDGPGIPAAERDKVLNPGYSSREEGTGFGLSIVRDIVQAHDWQISVDESCNGGARFEITGVSSP